MPTAPGLRERKKQATWAELSSAALRLAAARGPDGVTVEEISEAAGVSPRTFFNYFPSKEDAILGSDPDRAAGLAERLTQRPPEETPLEVMRMTLAGLADQFSDAPDAWGLRMRLVREHESLLPRYLATLVELERTLTRALAQRLELDPERDAYPGLVAATAVTAMRVSLRRWHARSHSVALQELLDDAFASLAAGLPPPADPI